MITKKGVKVAQYYTIFNYGPQIQHNNLNLQDIMILAGTGVNLETKTFSPGNKREKFGKETSPYEFLMDKLET